MVAVLISSATCSSKDTVRGRALIAKRVATQMDHGCSSKQEGLAGGSRSWSRSQSRNTGAKRSNAGRTTTNNTTPARAVLGLLWLALPAAQLRRDTSRLFAQRCPRLRISTPARCTSSRGKRIGQGPHTQLDRLVQVTMAI
jgi:hypothetical protein